MSPKSVQYLQAYHTLRRSTLFWGIVCTALIIRGGYLLLLTPRLESGSPVSVDALAYHQLAQNLVERHIFTSPVDPPYDPQLPGTFRPPLTPFFLAVIYQICGVNLLWGRLGLAIINALACGLTYWLGEHLFGRTVGLLAGIISCGYPFFLILVSLPLTEGLSLFLSLSLLTLLYAYNGHGIWWDVPIGCLFGLALLNKTTNIALLPCIFLLVLRSGSSIKIRVCRLFVIGVTGIIILLPWAIRNYTIDGTFIPVNSNGGWTFYLGNNPYTEQNLRALEQVATNGWIPPAEVFQPFADLSFADTKAWEERSRTLGYTFIRENPGTFLRFAARKLKIFWSPYHHILDQLTWYPLAFLSLLGLWCSFPSWKRHLILYILVLCTMGIPILFTSMPRFRAPIMPVIVIYGAAGIVKVSDLVRRRKSDSCASGLMPE